MSQSFKTGERERFERYIKKELENIYNCYIAERTKEFGAVKFLVSEGLTIKVRTRSLVETP